MKSKHDEINFGMNWNRKKTFVCNYNSSRKTSSTERERERSHFQQISDGAMSKSPFEKSEQNAPTTE